MPRRIRWVEATTPKPSIESAAAMRTSQDWQNIGRKLPLLTTALLTVAVTAISWTAYHEMRRTTVDAAGEHLLAVSRQIGGFFSDAEAKLRREGTPLSHDSVLARALVSSDPSVRAAALRQLTARAKAPNVYAVELWDTHGTRVLSAGNAVADTANASVFKLVVNPLVIVKDSVLTDVRVPILGRNADTLGVLRELARASSAQSKQIFAGLLGGQSILLVGNASGDVWTDLDRPVEGPPAGTARGRPANVLRGGVPWMGALSPVQGTPWVIWVASPQSEVLARVHGFLIRMLVVAIGVVVLGGLGARLLSGHVIAPLSEVTHAAEAIAGGDYSIRLKPVRHDEVGRLAEAFTTMAASIEQASLELSDQALELEAQQTELQEANEELRQTLAAMTAAREAHKQLEAQLQQAQKMEAVGRLAGGVAHDFNNMLTVMISYTDLVLANNTVSDDVRNDLKQVRSAADRAATLTRQLLAFSRKQVLRPSVVDVNEVVGGVTTMLARVMPENIRVSTTLGTGIEPVFVDRGQLEQVLMNLAVNARDAMAAGGALTIETSNAMLDDSYVGFHPGGAPGPHVVLSVRDTGIGMDAATRERIFEPFFTTKPVGQGTGLGLATVYGIVQQSGGSIYVYSEPGRGTIFKVYLPAHRAEEDARTDPAPAPAAAVESMNVLLVEDDPAVRDATRMVLKSLGHAVTAAPDVAAGLALVRASVERFDVVLTDAVMPGQSGLELAEILRIERPDLPVILMSGYAEETINFDPSKMPGLLFIEKPFTAPTIARALGQVKAGTRARAHA